MGRWIRRLGIGVLTVACTFGAVGVGAGAAQAAPKPPQCTYGWPSVSCGG